ncbi:UvrABC system protein C [Streptomyces glaucescens]
MVVFEDGLARKSEYRRFQIKSFAGQDDVRSMHEVITRRFRRYLAEKERTGEWAEDGEPGLAGGTDEAPALTEDDGRPKRFAYPPQLVVVDGGRPQVAAARRALDELGIDDIAVCGLAKRLEEVWLPGDDDPVILPRTSEGLYLLQRVRDEAHRFAIAYQRNKRGKRIRSSPLDEVPGLGTTRKQALIKHFGSVKKLRSATIDQICEVPGIGRKTAETIAAALAQAAPAAPAVNTATGEIMDDVEDGGTRDDGGCPRGARAHGRPGRATGAGDMTEHETQSTAGPQRATGEPEAQAAHAQPTPGRTGESRTRPESQSNGVQVNTGVEATGVPEAAIPELVIISGMSGPAGPRPRSAWRTSAGSSSTTCRPP